MARFDKYESATGGFRAALAADLTGAAAPLGVGLDTNGRIVAGPGTTGVLGVICQPKNKKAGDRIDVMVDGEILEFAGAAGSKYYAHATTGVISTTASIYRIGFTVEADRLHVRASIAT